MYKFLFKLIIICLFFLFALWSNSLKAQSSLSFTGNKTAIVIGNNPAVFLTQFSIECWFMRTGIGYPVSTGPLSAYPLVTRGRAEGDGSNVDINYFLGIEATKEVLCADFEANNAAPNPGKNHVIKGITRIANDVWYHAAVTLDGTNFKLYLNGNLEAQIAVSNVPQTQGMQFLCFGSAMNSKDKTAGGFVGNICEVRLWSVPILIADIKSNMFVQGLQNNNLVGRWPCNEGAGNFIADSTGNNLNGIVKGPNYSWSSMSPFQDILTLSRDPYLQQVSPTSATLCWRTNVPSSALIRYSTNWQVLPDIAVDETILTDHKVTITGLLPGKKYYYSIGSTTKLLQRDSNNTFTTAPLENSESLIWLTGDIGTGSIVPTNVFNSAQSYLAGAIPNVWINAGNQAYTSGNDVQYTSKFFDVFSAWLKKVCFFPTLGWFDYASSPMRQSDHSIAYNSIFQVEQGNSSGVPSNRKEYYSFDHGDIHFICLDAFGIEQNLRLYDTTSMQALWLKNDLSLSNKKWKVISLGIPFYTKGSIDGDTDSLMILLRATILPIIERYGVDLVIGGGSYAYERSFLLNGHTGTAADYKAWKHRLSSSKAKYDGSNNSCPYVKSNDSKAKGTVYVTLGTSGKRGNAQLDYPYPAMAYSNVNLAGSMILKVENNRLSAVWLKEDGVVADQFTIFKGVNDTISLSLNNGQQLKLDAPWKGNYQWTSLGSTDPSQSLTVNSNAAITVSDSLNCISRTWLLNVVGNDPLKANLLSPPNLSCCLSSNVVLKIRVSDPDQNTLSVKFFGRKKPTTSNAPSAFSIIGLPDTQYYTSEEKGGLNSFFRTQMDWIISHKDSLDIAFVAHYGDCVEHGDNGGNDIEWLRADSVFSLIENPLTTQLTHGIPYSICVGNHDQSPNGDANGTTTFYNQYFGSARFAGRNYYGGHYGANNDNHYELFSASGYDFIAVSLEYDEQVNTSVLAWADALLKQYSNRKAIVSSHFLLDIKAKFSAQGQVTFDYLKNNPNLFLMLCGHISGEAHRSDTVNGNVIYTILADYQTRLNGGTGWMNILQFVPSENRLKVKTYSPLYDIYETDQNSEFELDLNLHEKFKLIGTQSNVSSNSTLSYSWSGLSIGDYEWYVEVNDGINSVLSPIWNFTVTSPSISNADKRKSSQSVRLIPNPAKNSFTLETGDDNAHLVKIYSMDGWFIKNANTEGPTDISGLSAGSYMVSVLLKSGLRHDLLLLKF